MPTRAGFLREGILSEGEFANRLFQVFPEELLKFVKRDFVGVI